jgi:UDPglucose 6-dehydrogenase
MTKKPTFGVIGHGVVGKAHAKVWSEYVADIKIHDADPNRSVHSLEETAACDYVFIAVPTNRRPGSYECDTDIIESVFKKLAELPKCGVVVIKSTIPMGFTGEMTKIYPDLTIIHHPEFLTERLSLIDSYTPSRNLIGWAPDQKSMNAARDFEAMCKERFAGVPVYVMSAAETEYVKLSMNVIWAVKVGLFNELRKIADAGKLDWEHCREAILADGRITQSHTQVPGHDGKFGFGGKCLPKDLANMMIGARRLGVDTPIMQATWMRNQKDRDDQQL